MPINASKKTIYESIEMLHPNGTFMCYVGRKRANWYVNKNLAIWEGDKQFKLLFEPNGNGKNNMPFYCEKLENRCVVCGAYSNNINKHHVVPYVFRSRFPKQYKDNNHHDILVTCIDCHENYETHAMKYKISLVKQAGLSMHQKMGPIEKENKKILAARKLIEKISNGQLNIPEEKIAEIIKISKQEIKNYEKINGVDWADKLVEKIIVENTLFDFVKNWRRHFLDFAKPKYLPKHWSVDHALEISENK